MLQWLFQQMAGLGPMLGQNYYFGAYAPERIPYATDCECVAGDYSIADMASDPWIVPHERQQQDLDDFPNVKRWFETVAARPATIRAYERGKTINNIPR